jgi:hypothetical protein
MVNIPISIPVKPFISKILGNVVKTNHTIEK